jgi:hypothetical protein
MKRSGTVMERSGTVMERSGTVMERSGTVMQTFMQRSGTVVVERSGTPRNVRVGTQQRFGTNSGKHSRCVHGTLSVRSRSRFKNERNTVVTYDKCSCLMT